MRKLLWTGAIAGLVLLLLPGYLIFIDWGYQPLGRIYDGGWKRARQVARVGVLGDSQKGLANLRNITRAVLDEHVDVLLHTGDLVASNDDGHYRLAYAYLHAGGTSMPVVAPGNHDLKGGTARFETLCGPLEQSFTIDGVAFVIVNNAFGNPVPSPKHLEERIAAAGPHKVVIMAMHQPPFDLQGQARPEYADFLSWLEKSNLDYLVCGHVHGYLKKKVGDTTVIINGVGGDYDTWQLDQKVYATILEIDGNKITDRRLEREPVHEVWENIHHLAVGHFGEAYRRHPLPWRGGALVLAAGVAWALRRLFANREPFRAAPG